MSRVLFLQLALLLVHVFGEILSGGLGSKNTTTPGAFCPASSLVFAFYSRRLPTDTARDPKKHYFEHIRRIADKDNGIVLMITQKDLEIFIRQSINGKSNQAHIQELYDQTVREIS